MSVSKLKLYVGVFMFGTFCLGGLGLLGWVMFQLWSGQAIDVIMLGSIVWGAIGLFLIATHIKEK